MAQIERLKRFSETAAETQAVLEEQHMLQVRELGKKGESRFA